MKKVIAEREIKAASKIVSAEIAAMSVGKFGAGLASEGYAGGYRQALQDVLLVLNDVKPHTRNYWNDWRKSCPTP